MYIVIELNELVLLVFWWANKYTISNIGATTNLVEY